MTIIVSIITIIFFVGVFCFLVGLLYIAGPTIIEGLLEGKKDWERVIKKIKEKENK